MYLNKDPAKEVVKDLLKDNLGLDDSFYPLEDKLLIKKYPVVIDILEIYNPDEVPTVAPNGKAINNTSIYIELKFPMYIKFVGNVYKKIDIVVDTKSFYSQFQK